MNKNNQTGRSMIEMLGVLAIIGVLSVGGIIGYSNAVQKNKMNTMREQISRVIMNVKTAYANQGSFDGLTTERAIEAGIIPDDMQIKEVAGSDGRITRHIFNGEFLIEASVDPLDNKPLFMVVLTNLPKKAAIDISTANWRDVDGMVQIDLVNNSQDND